MLTPERQDKTNAQTLVAGQRVTYVYIPTEVLQVRKRKKFAKRYLIGSQGRVWVRRDQVVAS